MTEPPIETVTAKVTREKRELQDQLDIYKPVLLSLVLVLACTGIWLLALALTGTTSLLIGLVYSSTEPEQQGPASFWWSRNRKGTPASTSPATNLIFNKDRF
jgi:hypothetical protein